MLPLNSRSLFRVGSRNLPVARDVTTGRLLASRVSVATRWQDRLRGLLGQAEFQRGDALWITPCRGVHTWWMRFSIDLIALDATGIVVDAVAGLRPWRMRLPRPGAVGVLELPIGMLAHSRTRLGNRVVFEPLVPDLE